MKIALAAEESLMVDFILQNANDCKMAGEF